MGVASSSSSSVGEGEDARASSSFVDATSREGEDESSARDATTETPTATETTMRFVEELEDGSTRVVRLFDDDDDDGRDENDARSRSSPPAVLERRVAMKARETRPGWSTTWTRVYDAARHSSSFRGRGGMLERCAGRGAVMLVISPRRTGTSSGDGGVETASRLYAGVFSPELPATPRHDFRGDDACASFRVDANDDVIDTSGPSSTPLYCAYGYTTRPNGVGLFGVVGRHALFLDESLETGHADYGARAFDAARIEVWTITSSDASTRAPTATVRASSSSAASSAAARRRADALFDARFAASSIAADIADASRG